MSERPRSAGQDAWVRNPAWTLGRAAAAGLVHGMITRRGFDSVGKAPLAETIARVAPAIERMLECDQGKKGERVTLVAGDQVHGDRIVVIQNRDNLGAAQRLSGKAGKIEALDEFPATDALVTTLPRLLLLIQTADCLPVLLWDARSRMIGACHCGWRGLLARLAQRTARRMIEIGASPETLEVWLGPGIRAENYEVGADLVERFRGEFPDAPISPDGRRLDLPAIACHQIAAEGIHSSNIIDSGECTYADPAKYHSYRRDRARAGRLLTIIGLMTSE